METKWVDVFEGPPWKAQVIRGELESSGIPVFVPDENVEVMDPFIKGGSVFDLKVCVPETEIEAAREIVAARAMGEPGARGDAAALGDDSRRRRAERLGARVRWLAILPVTAPIALALAFAYFSAARSLSPKPKAHALTILATVLAVAWMWPIALALAE